MSYNSAEWEIAEFRDREKKIAKKKNCCKGCGEDMGFGEASTEYCNGYCVRCYKC